MEGLYTTKSVDFTFKIGEGLVGKVFEEQQVPKHASRAVAAFLTHSENINCRKKGPCNTSCESLSVRDWHEAIVYV
eukprot:5833996-Amphidinium_carterae.1